MIGEYLDKRTTVEAIRNLLKLAQIKSKFPGELGVRDKKLAIQAQFADLYVEALQNECIGMT